MPPALLLLLPSLFAAMGAAVVASDGCLLLLLLLLLSGVFERPSMRSSITSGCPLPLLAAAATERLRLLLLMILRKQPSGLPAAAAAPAWLPGLGNSSGALCRPDMLQLLLLLLTAAACLTTQPLPKQAAGCRCVRHEGVLLQALLLLLLAR
jgi:hypothetical protein